LHIGIHSAIIILYCVLHINLHNKFVEHTSLILSMYIHFFILNNFKDCEDLWPVLVQIRYAIGFVLYELACDEVLQMRYIFFTFQTEILSVQQLRRYSFTVENLFLIQILYLKNVIAAIGVFQQQTIFI